MKTASTLPKVYTLADVARLIARTPQRVSQLVKDGELPSRKHGRSHLFVFDDLAPLLKRRRII